MAHLGSEPDGVRDLERGTERRLLGLVGRVLGLVAAGEVGPDPGHPHRPVLLRSRCRRDDGGPVGGCGTAAAQSGVHLELEQRRPAEAPGRGRDLTDLLDGGRREVDPGVHRRGVVLPGHRQPRQHPAGVAGGAQRERLLEEGDPEPGRATGPGRPGHRHHAVAVAVGLDHGHHPSRCGASDEGRDVGTDRVEVDHELGPGLAHGASSSRAQTSPGPRAPPRRR